MTVNRSLALARAILPIALATMLFDGQTFAGCLHLVGDGPRLSADRARAEFTFSNTCGQVIWVIGCGVDVENGRTSCDWRGIAANSQVRWPLFPDEWRHFEVASCAGLTSDSLAACLKLREDEYYADGGFQGNMTDYVLLPLK